MKNTRKYLPLLRNSNMFRGIKESEIESMLTCLSARIVHYKKQDYILRSEDSITSVGMVLSGLALVEKDDFWGNCTIISEITPGIIFAESYACLAKMPAEISVIASEDTDVMFFDFHRILNVCTSACTFHTRLIRNLVATLAAKNLKLTRKMEHISKKTIRERLLSYLSAESRKAGTTAFTIPFNRQQLADYLSVDRSALSNEIGKLQKEGVLLCRKNYFQLQKTTPS